MKSASRLPDALPRAAKLAAIVLPAYALVLRAITGANLPSALFSPAGLFISGAAGILMTASAVSFLAGAGGSGGAPLPARLARALLWMGLALCFAGLPRSFAKRAVYAFAVGEGQTIPAGYREGLPELRFGPISIAPAGDNIFLSKRVNIEMSYMTIMGAVKTLRVGLFPPARAGSWRLSINKFGYAPFLEWKGPDGATIRKSWIMLGTFQHTQEEASLVRWTPAPNLMLGVGYYPPKIEDLIRLPGEPYYLFVRIEEAAINGRRRDMRSPNAYRFMADGRLENPEYLVKVFRGAEKIYDGRVKPGENVVFPGGSVTLSKEVLLWVEIQAVLDRWLSCVEAGAAMIAGGALLGIAAGIAARRRRVVP